MANNINWENIVGSRTIDDGGYAGQLLELALVHLVQAKESGTLTEAQVGEIYATTIGQTIGQAIQFEMTKEATEIAIEDAAEKVKMAIAQTASIRRKTI